MKRCPISYEIIPDEASYSKSGLKLLSPKLQKLEPLGFSAEEQRREAIFRANKMSIQGVQTKLSAQLNIKGGYFQLVDAKGQYILKTQSSYYPELPENEAITMTMAATIGIKVPVHGLLYAKDNSMTYFIKRFDRVGKTQKLALEDFAQLLGKNRDIKYASSMEQVADVVNQFCSFPKIESIHLLISPAYDLLNTTIASSKPKEELALPLKGKKSNLSKKDFLSYYAIGRLKLNQRVIDDVLSIFQEKIPSWYDLISNSFLSQDMKKKYQDLLHERTNKLF